MASSTIQQNLIPNEPELRDLLDLYRKQILLGLNCHHLGTIQSFDSTKQTAVATINYKKTFFQPDPDTGVYVPILQDYPILLDCPVVCMGGGGGALTFPIASGDECLILFNDRDIDNWFNGGSGAALNTARLHSFSDGLIIVGVRSLANVIKNYDATRVELRNAPDGSGPKVSLGETLIQIANATQNLGTLIQDLITAIKSLVTATAAITVTGVTTGTGVSGVPANAATITAINTTLTTIATNFSELIE